jgi:RNA-directed DNA polymerase
LLLVFDKLRAEGGEAPGIDGLSYRDFSRSEIAAALRVVAQQLQQRHYRPRPTRQVRIAKCNGGFRKLRLMTVIDRIIAKVVQLAIMPTLDPVFLPGVFGFRPGRSIQRMLLAIEKAATEHDCWVIAQDGTFTNRYALRASGTDRLPLWQARPGRPRGIVPGTARLT